MLNTAPAPTTTTKMNQRSQAWIAGPVVGGLAGVIIFLLVAWFLFRMRRTKQGRHEVHGESTKKSELEVKALPQELDGQGQNRQPVELPTNCL